MGHTHVSDHTQLKEYNLSKARKGARWLIGGAFTLVGKGLGATADVSVGGVEGGVDAAKALKDSPKTKSTVEAGKKVGGYIKDKVVAGVNRIQVATTESSNEEKEG